MPGGSTTQARPQGLPALARLALKLAWRDLRGGLRGFGVFIACLALGVAAIAAVTSVARGVGEGLSREGKRILGGDAAFSLIHREATAQERSYLASKGDVSVMATMRAMVNAGDKGSALVEVKAVDAGYPTVGDLRSEPALPLPGLLAARDGAFGALVDPLILGRLDLKVGERIQIGETSFVITGTVLSEPDKVAAGVGLGPRLLMSESALRQTGLVQPGSLIRWTYRLNMVGSAGPSETADGVALAALEADAKRVMPEAGWEVRTRANADPRFSRNIDRFSQFLTLVGLTALLVGGVGVANAVRRFVDTKRMDFATLKALGAPGSQVVAIHLVEVMLVACIGITIGVLAGASLPYVLSGALSGVLPLPLSPTIAWSELGIAALYGLITALVFALLPLGQAHDTPVSALFRDVVDADNRRPRRVYLIAFGLALSAMVGITILFAYDARIAAIYIGVIAAAFVMLRGVGSGIMRAAAAMPRSTWPSLRMAVANMHRPGALTPALVLSLGLGVALLSALSFIDASLTRALTQNLPERAPSYFFLDIPSARTAEFDQFATLQSPGASIERVPLMRGRVVSLNGVPAEQVKAADRFSWVLEGDRGITFAAELPRDSKLVTGEWWPQDYRGQALVSFDHDLASGLGLKIGDEIVVNVLGRNITARLGNTRKVEWRNLGINFVMLFSPNSFAGAPHTHLATLTMPPSAKVQDPDQTTQLDALMLRALARDFPSVTAVRVKDALDAANELVGRLTFAIRAASGIAVAASLLVLAGALAAGQRARLYDAMILKTLGATRSRILGAYGLEYALTGLVAALFGLLAGAAAGWAVTTQAMNIEFAFAPTAAILLAGATVSIAVIFGLAGTLRILSKKPASYLRSL